MIELVTKKDFAAICGVSQGRVSHWIADGRLSQATEGSGRFAKIKLEAGLRLVRRPGSIAKMTAFVQAKPPSAGDCVYIIAASGGPVKVGVTNHPQRRLERLRTGSPLQLRLAYIEPVPAAYAREVEQAAHLWLSPHRIRGEWFATSVDVARTAIRAALAFIENSRLPCG